MIQRLSMAWQKKNEIQFRYSLSETMTERELSREADEQ